MQKINHRVCKARIIQAAVSRVGFGWLGYGNGVDHDCKLAFIKDVVKMLFPFNISTLMMKS